LGRSETWAWTMRQPSGRRTQTWLWRPRIGCEGLCGVAAGEARSNSRVMVAKSQPKVTMSRRVTVRARPAFREGFEFAGAVEVFGHAEAHDLGGGPEHGYQGVDVVGYEGLFVARVEGGEFGDDGGVVDDHWMGKSLRGGRICLAMAAETVWMGWFTTWLRRRRMATEHRM